MGHPATNGFGPILQPKANTSKANLRYAGSRFTVQAKTFSNMRANAFYYAG